MVMIERLELELRSHSPKNWMTMQLNPMRMMMMMHKLQLPFD
jgi:hypothetical protein